MYSPRATGPTIQSRQVVAPLAIASTGTMTAQTASSDTNGSGAESARPSGNPRKAACPRKCTRGTNHVLATSALHLGAQARRGVCFCRHKTWSFRPPPAPAALGRCFTRWRGAPDEHWNAPRAFKVARYEGQHLVVLRQYVSPSRRVFSVTDGFGRS